MRGKEPEPADLQTKMFRSGMREVPVQRVSA